MGHCTPAVRERQLRAALQGLGQADDLLPERAALLLGVCRAALLQPGRAPLVLLCPRQVRQSKSGVQ